MVKTMSRERKSGSSGDWSVASRAIFHWSLAIPALVVAGASTIAHPWIPIPLHVDLVVWGVLLFLSARVGRKALSSLPDQPTWGPFVEAGLRLNMVMAGLLVAAPPFIAVGAWLTY